MHGREGTDPVGLRQCALALHAKQDFVRLAPAFARARVLAAIVKIAAIGDQRDRQRAACACCALGTDDEIALRCDDFLARATGRLLRVPHLDPPPALTPRVVSYAYADPELEALSPAARHLLRCGPDNSHRIQEKLRALAAAVPVTPR